MNGGIFNIITQDGPRDNFVFGYNNARMVLYERLRRIQHEKDFVDKFADLFIDHIDGPVFRKEEVCDENMYDYFQVIKR